MKKGSYWDWRKLGSFQFQPYGSPHGHSYGNRPLFKFQRPVKSFVCLMQEIYEGRSLLLQHFPSLP